jgi:diguanylate cyclase (GGDEF)-like protein
LHCAIVREKSGRWLIEDLGSTNGTLVNGGRVTRIELGAGDRIQLGPDVVLQFGFYDDAEESLATKLYEAATRDPLTRAHNRRYLMERLSAEVSFATRHSQKLVAVIFDIDHFKRVNDAHGHQAGDIVLKDVAVALSECIRPMDTVARFGGEEFSMILPNCAPFFAQQVAERIRTHVNARSIAIGAGQEVSVTVSIGGAFAPQWVRSSALLWVERADQQLYRAKSEGRNRACLEQPMVSHVSAEEKGLLFGTSHFAEL